MLSRSLRRLHDIGSLRAACAFDDLEFYTLTLSQRLEPIALDCREMDKNIIAVFPLDETIALFCADQYDLTNNSYSSCFLVCCRTAPDTHAISL